MPKSFEYQVCQIQESRVTFVNGVWQGEREMVPDNPDASLNSCPQTWEYLQEAGAAGWELVGALNRYHPGVQVQQLFLKREKL
ncbi:hypothetical protein HYR99_05605 [Candidatus Poribacteria bacterium]|nr:hypothetical protein [Candidatus Poribacteria bacterium]